VVVDREQATLSLGRTGNRASASISRSGKAFKGSIDKVGCTLTFAYSVVIPKNYIPLFH